MRTLKLLTAGWVLGGMTVVALAAFTESQSTLREELPAVPAPSERPATPPEFASALVSRRHAISIPVAGVDADALVDTFGSARGGGRRHAAIDILAPRGTPVVAAADGTIRKLFTSKAGGLTIYQFDRSEALVFYYAHLDQYADIHEGQGVRRGDILGFVGMSGNASPATPHLHFAIERLPPSKEWWKGEAINPYPILRGQRGL